MCWKKQTESTVLATAKSLSWVTPDIITVTDVIATLSRSETGDKEKVDQVFQDAVERRIILRKDTLDSDFEVDLTGMSLPVARAACRFIFSRIRARVREGQAPTEVTLLTGVGRAQHLSNEDAESSKLANEKSQVVNQELRPPTALREYILQILIKDFVPPLRGSVPQRAQGTVVIEKGNVEGWIASQ